MGRCLASLADQTEVARMVDRAAALEFGDQVRAVRAAALGPRLTSIIICQE
jgi:hypothetical protein